MLVILKCYTLFCKRFKELFKKCDMQMIQTNIHREIYIIWKRGMEKLKKTIIAVATVVALSLGSTAIVNTAYANPTNDIHNQQSSIKSQRADIKKNLSKADAEIADILFELKELNTEMVRVENALEENKKVMKDTEDQISTTENDITVLEDEIVELEANIEERNELLKRRITAYQKSGGSIGFLEVIFGSKSFNEFISRTTAVTKITTSDADLLQKQEDDKLKVESQQVTLEAKLAEQLDMKTELEGMKELILVQAEKNEGTKKELKTKEAQINSLKAELQTKDSNLASVEAQIRRDIAAESARVLASQADQGQNLVQLGDKQSSKAPAQSNQTAGTTTNSSNTTQKQPVNKPVSGGTGNLSVAINAGYQHLGTPYKWAGKGPGGFDCSGFVSWSFGQAGISIPSSTSGLSATGQKVAYSDIQPGDLVFFNTYKVNGHVGIYVGNGQFIGAQNSTGLAVASMSSAYWGSAFKGHVRRVR